MQTYIVYGFGNRRTDQVRESTYRLVGLAQSRIHYCSDDERQKQKKKHMKSGWARMLLIAPELPSTINRGIILHGVPSGMHTLTNKRKKHIPLFGPFKPSSRQLLVFPLISDVRF